MKRALICFTRPPAPGRTKTRLMPLLSGDACAALHTAFLRDIAAVCGRVDADLYVAYAPEGDWGILRELFPAALDLFPQDGEGLGERMHRALSRVLALGYDACVLIGSDLPELTEGHLAAAFAALEEADASLGPTEDGGYYLVGLKKPSLPGRPTATRAYTRMLWRRSGARGSASAPRRPAGTWMCRRTFAACRGR